MSVIPQAYNEKQASGKNQACFPPPKYTKKELLLTNEQQKRQKNTQKKNINVTEKITTFARRTKVKREVESAKKKVVRQPSTSIKFHLLKRPLTLCFEGGNLCISLSLSSPPFLKARIFKGGCILFWKLRVILCSRELHTFCGTDGTEEGPSPFWFARCVRCSA